MYYCCLLPQEHLKSTSTAHLKSTSRAPQQHLKSTSRALHSVVATLVPCNKENGCVGIYAIRIQREVPFSVKFWDYGKGFWRFFDLFAYFSTQTRPYCNINICACTTQLALYYNKISLGDVSCRWSIFAWKFFWRAFWAEQHFIRKIILEFQFLAIFYLFMTI